MGVIMLRKEIILFFFLVSFVTISFGQVKQITNEKYKFTLTSPTGLLPVEDGTTILEFHGTAEKYGKDALFFLKSVIPLNISPIERLESYMQDVANIEAMDKEFIDSMKPGFPDIKSIDKSFIYFNDRPAMQSIYSFSVRKTLMKGRFILVLVKEQSSVYVFSWTSKVSMYESWNKASEKFVKSLKIQ